jgi:hypothetical protein
MDSVRAHGTSTGAIVAQTRQVCIAFCVFYYYPYYVQAILERGEKLSEIEDRTANMSEGSKQYANHASALVDKMKNKKWYQL